MDFLIIDPKPGKYSIELFPEFRVGIHSKDLMTRGRDFYAVWDEDRKLWSEDENDLVRMVDNELEKARKKLLEDYPDKPIVVHWMRISSSHMIDRFHDYCSKQTRENFIPLNETIVFANTETTKDMYASKKLPYPLSEGDISAWDKMVSTLYSPEERHKIEWAIGSIVSGDSKHIQKFLVFYGDRGTGKSTIMDVIEGMFQPYCCTFDASALGRLSSEFALEPFRTNPLVAIQSDANLANMEINTRLNSLTSHDPIIINEKHKSTYTMRVKAMLFMGSNDPVKITNAQSGLLRRLIDVNPTGKKLPYDEYMRVKKEIQFEYGAIAEHCLNVYSQNPTFYEDYVPKAMMEASNEFYNFVIDNYLLFLHEDPISIDRVYDLYKAYVTLSDIKKPLSKINVREEFKAYYKKYEDYAEIDGKKCRSVYSNFKSNIIEKTRKVEVAKKTEDWLVFSEQPSQFDISYASNRAQYANDEGTPLMPWSDVKTTLKDIDTSRLHYVLMDIQHVTVDFDIRGENGEKSFERNVVAASKFPATYAELSKSGQGIHLEYIYTGDTSKLSHIFDEHVEIKTFPGNSSLRRKLTLNNGHPITVISSGLPLKEEKPTISQKTIEDNRHLHILLMKCLAKEYGSTKSSMDFIKKLLDEAYSSGIVYDVNDMAPAILAFASHSSNRSKECIKIFNTLKLQSETEEKMDEKEKLVENNVSPEDYVFFDVEVYPNLFLVVWKKTNGKKIKMFNPLPDEVRKLFDMKLIGFNCRRYDNHMLYARSCGYDNLQLFNLSQRIIQNHTGFIREAYNISYTDVYDFASKKQSLKKWEIDLDIHHQEMVYPWDQEIPEEKWPEVADYCGNDVDATEALFYNLKGDWTARQILAKISGMTPNDTTNTCTTKFIFQGDAHPKLEVPDLSIEFPGYEYIPANMSPDKKAHNMYRDTDVGFGGYVKETVGYWINVALLDVRSLHPNSAIALNAFGEYTKRFKDIVDIRAAIKAGDLEKAKTMFNGELAEYLNDPETAGALEQALKIAINSVYGLTSATFENAFKDVRNVNNIVALRGALFMRTLEDEVTARGFVVAHIKTDSIKIPDATPEIIDFCYKFANKYGYTFEHEATYEKMCLVNKSVYIAKYATVEKCNELYGADYVESAKDICKKNKKYGGQWTATGKEFQIDYVFKKLFSKSDIIFNDLCETFSVTSSLYLYYEDKDEYQFIGKVGRFMPVKKEYGAKLLREADGKYDSATGAKGYYWAEAEKLRLLEPEEIQKRIDYTYFNSLTETALDDLRKYVDPEEFID